MENKETRASFYVRCEGVLKYGLSTLSERAEASITVFKDGSREVGCSYLDKTTGKCQVADQLKLRGKERCAHLFPGISAPKIRIDSEQPKDFRGYSHITEVSDGRKFGIQKEADGQESVELIPDGVKFIARSTTRTPLAPDHPEVLRLEQLMNTSGSESK